jgi:hypothetical protein
MIGKPLIVMPEASTSSRVGTINWPALLVPSPETSTTRRKPLYPLSSNSGLANCSAPEMDVREARRYGARLISAATASADSGPSIRRQGMMTFWSNCPAHSK